MQRLFGAHVSIAGGYHEAVSRIAAMGGNALQIFSSSPRGWNMARPTDEDIAKFKQEVTDKHIRKIFFHASYLINLANGDRGGSMSVQNLTNELNLADKVGVVGSIIHTGSFKNHGNEENTDIRMQEGYRDLCKNIESVIKNTPENTYMILENAGNRKIGRYLEDLGSIISDLQSGRIKVCLDTCHLHAAGYDLSTSEAFSDFLEKTDKIIGLKNIAVFHINDSRDPFGSLRDRHENIGEGMVGEAFFQNILNAKEFKNVPMIIETPGFDGNGPDKRNLDIMKSYIKQ